MHIRIARSFLATVGATLAAAVLVACSKAPEPEATPAPPAPTETPVPAPSGPADAPSATPAPGTDPTTTPPAPAQPDTTPPPPTEPSAVPKPTATDEPALESMRTAKASAKASVPVDLRYEIEGEALPDRSVTLHLAAVPRVSGANLNVSIKDAAGVEVSAATLAAQKASARSAYRQRYSLTRRDPAATGVRVLVTMDMPEGTAFGFFTVPFEGGNSAQKQESVKQR